RKRSAERDDLVRIDEGDDAHPASGKRKHDLRHGRRKEACAVKPLWHRLVEGGLGEVVPAEILQGVVQAQHDAVDLLAGDHAIDWRGLPVHDDLRWPKAAAKIQILDEFRDSGSIDEVEQRILFAEGFSEPPKIKGAQREIPWGGYTLRGWWVEWKLNSAGSQAAMIGFEVKDLSVPLATPRLIDLDAWRADDEGRGMA